MPRRQINVRVDDEMGDFIEKWCARNGHTISHAVQVSLFAFASMSSAKRNRAMIECDKWREAGFPEQENLESDAEWVAGQ